MCSMYHTQELQLYFLFIHQDVNLKFIFASFMNHRHSKVAFIRIPVSSVNNNNRIQQIILLSKQWLSKRLQDFGKTLQLLINPHLLLSSQFSYVSYKMRSRFKFYFHLHSTRCLIDHHNMLLQQFFCNLKLKRLIAMYIILGILYTQPE